MSVSYTVRDGVALIVIENPPVNSISAAVRVAIASALGRAQHDSNVVAVVLMGGARMFCGGAEVREFNTPFQLQKPTLPELNVLQDAFGKPLVAAIQGVALGGGLELALGCHWRIAHEDARLGLPEVTLGLMPGSGGSQRLPRLMGMTPALRMMVTGAPVAARTAYDGGLVDALAEGDLQDAAVVFARTVAQREGGGIRRVRDLPIPGGESAVDELRDFRRSHPITARSLSGVRHVIDACEAAATLPFDQGLAFERQRFLQLLAAPEFKALSYAFFALRQARKVGALPVPSCTVPSVAFGSIGQRMLRRYLQEAQALLEEGCTPHHVDSVMEAWGMEQGPFALDDAFGLDQLDSGEGERAELQGQGQWPTIRQRLLEQGRRGRRTGAGWYVYREGRSLPEVDPHVHDLLVRHRADIGIVPRPVPEEKILSRLTLALIQEAGELMAEGATDRASNIDAVWLAGYGFPASRGGPVFHGKTLGISSVLASMQAFATGHRGERWAPSAGLAHLADFNP